MKVLVACEYSGIVRDAFIRKGHDAMSCDILPTEREGPHYEGDIFDILYDGWDLMVAHPPCTYLCVSGARWLYEKQTRWQDLIEGATFLRDLLNAPVPKVAVENPKMHKWATKIVGRKADQTIQPWQFGHPEKKGTQFWLKNLPLLEETNNVRGEMEKLSPKEQSRIWWMGGGKGHERSRFFEGIAEAMADQWGEV